MRTPAASSAAFSRLVVREVWLAEVRDQVGDLLTQLADPDVLAASGERFHPIVSPSSDPSDEVAGMVFRISADELAAADHYEVADYVRVQVRLKSGRDAWVYVKA